jgi:hypothetical protein
LSSLGRIWLECRAGQLSAYGPPEIIGLQAQIVGHQPSSTSRSSYLGESRTERAPNEKRLQREALSRSVRQGNRMAFTAVVPPLLPIVSITVTGFVDPVRFTGDPAAANPYR